MTNCETQSEGWCFSVFNLVRQDSVFLIQGGKVCRSSYFTLFQFHVTQWTHSTE